MKPVSILWVVAVGLVAAGLSFLGFLAHMRQGGTPLIVTPGPAVIFAIATACLIWSGLAVRRLRAGKDTWIDAIGAMRVAVFARTSALVGSGLTGILIGTLVRHQPRRRGIDVLQAQRGRLIARSAQRVGAAASCESRPRPER